MTLLTVLLIAWPIVAPAENVSDLWEVERQLAEQLTKIDFLDNKLNSINEKLAWNLANDSRLQLEQKDLQKNLGKRAMGLFKAPKPSAFLMLGQSASFHKFLRTRYVLHHATRQDLEQVRVLKHKSSQLKQTRNSQAKYLKRVRRIHTKRTRQRNRLAHIREMKLQRMRQLTPQQRDTAWHTNASNLAKIFSFLSSSSTSEPSSLPKNIYPLPVAGRISYKVGAPLLSSHNTKRKSDGTYFDILFGSPVYAICAGQVEYAKWLDGYGYTVVVKCGKRHILYAHLQKLDVSDTMAIRTGDKIGTVGESSALPNGAFYLAIWSENQWLEPHFKENSTS